MRTKEIFDRVRSQQNRFSLRLRLTLLVSAELLVSEAVGWAVFQFLRDRFLLESDALLLIALVTISLLIGCVVTSLLSKAFFGPIKKLGQAMEKVADGDFSVRLEEKSRSKEILEVCSGFNLMANELSAMEVLQTDFVSNVSHEFKTPISAIEGYSTLLQGSEELGEQERAYVDKILYNTRRLSSLMSSILLLSKLENQQISTNRTRYRLDEQIRQSVVALEPDWLRRETEFDVELESLEYLGSEPMMRHVWNNLIGNAIKFGPRGGLVKLRLYREGDRAVFLVEDMGPGISEEAQKHLFDKFYQADSSHKQEGNGLGLALVKRILTIEDGTVTAENTPTGALFRVTLKLK